MVPRSLVAVGTLVSSLTLGAFLVSPQQASATTRVVPDWYPTIQAAIDAAVTGDVVLVSPGVYVESLTLSGKAITIASHFYLTGDRNYIGQTVIDGGGAGWVIRFDSSVGPGAAIVGLTLRHADDGVRATGKFNFLNNRVTNTGDGIDFGGGSGGLVRGCVFEGNSDDGIDLDNHVAVVIEQNTIQNNGDDGIEIRLHAYTGPELKIVIRDNTISGNNEDGIQLISYETLTARRIHIERNFILNNAMAGVGMMCCENTVENYQGSSSRERVLIYHNTFVGNDHGVTGADSVIILNNIFYGTTNIALKRAGGGSIAAYNLLFNNGVNYSESNVDSATTVLEDPLLAPDYRLWSGSPAIDAGTAFYTIEGEVVLNQSAGEYSGAAPDLGIAEFQPTASVPGVSGTLELSPARPNPFTGETRFAVTLVEATEADVGVFDLSGRRVATLHQGRLEAGMHTFRWDGTRSDGARARDGVYFYRARAGRASATGRLVLLL